MTREELIPDSLQLKALLSVLALDLQSVMGVKAQLEVLDCLAFLTQKLDIPLN